MAHGYQGKILKVNLTDRRIDAEEKDESFYRSYLGGRGIGYHYLLREVPPRIDPFSPENVLVLATGVMTGAPLPASCRFAAVGKSPLTGTAGESEAAGFFGPELKMAGFDAIVFQGRADKPVYLWVSDGKEEGTLPFRETVGRPETWRASGSWDAAGLLFFHACDGEGPEELWVSDGTNEGTLLFRDAVGQPETWHAGVPVDVAGLLYFYASDGDSGADLWVSDGTTDGTLPFRDALGQTVGVFCLGHFPQ